MITTNEKLQAIRSEFPHIPQQDASKVAERVRIDGDLYRLASIVAAYIRHTHTLYDGLQSGQYYGSYWKEARATVQPKVNFILSSWR